jgi:FkbM family methyltransferase
MKLLSMQLARLMKRRSTLALRVYKYCTFLKNNFDNLDFNMASNGELNVIQQLRLDVGDVVLDVGGNEGDWTLAVLRNSKSSNVYAFEVVPATRTLFSSNVQSELVTLLPYGLGDVQREIEMFVDPQDTGKSTSSVSLATRRVGFCKESISCRVEVGDQFLDSLAIDHVRLLKIDVEGSESQVLSGFIQAFSNKNVDIVQFEYGEVCIDTRFLLQDFYKFFETYGFVLGKIYPTFVDFKEYEYSDENFLGCNYLAVRKDLRMDIQRLSR